MLLNLALQNLIKLLILLHARNKNANVVEHLPSICGTLGLIPRTVGGGNVLSKEISQADEGKMLIETI